MTRHHPNRIAAATFALALGACGGSSATSPTPAAPAASTPVGGTSLTPPTAEAGLLAILNADIQDEYRAEAIYRGVLLDFGAETRPFANIVQAEAWHAAAVAGLFTARGLPVPSSLRSPANVPRFATLRAACAAAVQAEVENIALYDSQLGASLPDDVLRVIQNNRAASVNNHLPAFQRCQ
jgi:hypothetical protein